MTMQMEQGQTSAAAKEVAGEAGTQAKAVASEAKGQAQHLVGQAKEQLQQQAQSRSQEAASTLRSLSQQLTALAEGRPQEAGQLTDYLRQLRTKVTSFADQLEQRGPQGAMQDVSRYARRKPGVFLVGALGAGFAVGRLVRAGASASHEHQQSQGQLYGQPYGQSQALYDAPVPAMGGTTGLATGGMAGMGDPIAAGYAEETVTTVEEW